MGLRNEVNAIYNSMVGTANVRYRQYPAAVAGIVVADDAAWDEIVASTVITTDYWIAGLNIGGPAAGITADTEEVIACGSGGADGATVAAATLLIEHDLIATINTAVGEYPWPPIYLPIPVKVLASTRIATRISTSATGGLAISFGFTAITSLGN